MTDTSATSLVIAVCTLRRPEQLDRTLACLRVQAETSDAMVEILVVDNDPGQSALAPANRHGASYIHEPVAGLGSARNAALAAVRERQACEGVVFFDDDQVPLAGWLNAFIEAHRRSPHDVLTGPVQPRLDFQVPAWAEGGWPWTRPVRADGARLKTFGDGNLLIPATALSRPECSYSPAFSSGMGQDAELSFRLHAAGVAIRFARDAGAFEDVPQSRRSPEWAIGRAHLSADAWARVVQTHFKYPRVRIAGAILHRSARLIGHMGARRSEADRVRRLCSLAELRALRRRLVSDTR